MRRYEKHYSPLNDTEEKADKRQLYSDIDKLMADMEMQRNQIAELKTLSLRLAVEMMILGKIPPQSITDMLEMGLESDCFMVGAIDLCNKNELFDENGRTMVAEEDLTTVKEAIFRTFEDRLGHLCIIYCCDACQYLGSFLINLPDSSITENYILHDTISKALADTVSMLEKYLGIWLYVALSGVVEKVEKLPKAKAEAERVLGLQRDTTEAMRVVEAQSLSLIPVDEDGPNQSKSVNGSLKYKYSLERELLNAMKKQNLGNIHTTMILISQHEISQHHDIMRLSNYVTDKLMGILIYNGVDLHDARLSSRLEEIRNVCHMDELLEAVSSFFVELDKRKNELPPIRMLDISAIKDYIEKNCCNLNISLSLIAGIFNQSQSGLSRVFKKEYGAGILETIHRLRVEKAKTQLTETGKTVDDIYKSVGYTNRRTFNRVFKQYTGMTATTYRKGSGK